MDPQVGHEASTHLDVSFDVSGAPLLALDVDLDEIVPLKMSFKPLKFFVALNDVWSPLWLDGMMKHTLAYGGLGHEPTHMEELLDILDGMMDL